MEIAGEPAIHSIQTIISIISDSSRSTDPQSLALVQTELGQIADVIGNLRSIFARMYEENSPAVFYNQLRPFMTGWENNPHHTSKGVYYEGVVDPENPPKPTADMTDTTGSYQKYAGMPRSAYHEMYLGGSAGQSPLIHALDIALDIKHYSTGDKNPSVYIYEMRKYISE